MHIYQLPFTWYILGLLSVSVLLWKTYYAFRGPLSHLPGSKWSRITRFPLKRAILQGERVRFVHALHERFGPVVRISPTEVSLADIDAAKRIYKVGGTFYKSQFYDDLTGNQPHRNVFTMTDPKTHGAHRRLTAFNFSEKWVSQLEPFIAKNVKLAIDRMAEEDSSDGSFDAFKWFNFMATDVIGESSFGESFRMLELREKNQYIHDLESVGSRNTFRSEFMLLTKLLSLLPIGPAKEIHRSLARFNGYAEESIQRYWRQLRADRDNVKPTLLTKEFAEVENGTITAGQIQRDAVGNIVAGTDTTAITATYAVWLLAHHLEIQEAVIREVSTLPSDFKDEDLRQLKLLGNVINETLRLHGPVGQGLPRVVPRGGADFAGFFVPEGSIVGIQAYTMHRLPQVWSEAERFNPSRWDSQTKDMMHSFLPFGGGSHVCIGSHFAQLELRHALANFYREFIFGVKPAAGFDEEEMLQKSFFLSPPRSKACYLSRRK